MAHVDTSTILLDGMCAALDCWETRHGGKQDVMYWVLRCTLAQTGLVEGATPDRVQSQIPIPLTSDVQQATQQSSRYWDDIRYASLEPVTRLWGTIVNSLRVMAKSDRATTAQHDAFRFENHSLISFLRAARERMEIADQLYHAFKAMPAPECQALAALLNVHVDAPLAEKTVCRLVCLLDHEGPMSPSELDDLESLQNTRLVGAAFRGLRGSG